MQEPQTIPVWIEAIVRLTVTPDEDADGNADWSIVDLTPAAAALLPGADIVAACTLDRVHDVMEQEAADARETLDEVRRMLTNAIGAAESGFASIEQVVNALRNIRASIPVTPDRSEDIRRRAEEATS